MDRREVHFTEEELLSEGTRSRRGIHVSPLVLLAVALLNVFLLASLALYVRETTTTGPGAQRRHERQIDYPPERDPGSLCPPYIQCCQSLDRSTLRQLCNDVLGTTTAATQKDCGRSTAGPLTTPTSTSSGSSASRRMTPAPKTTPATTTTTTTPMTTTTATMTTTLESDDNSFDKLRLPRHLRPFHYNIHWKPDFYQTDPNKFSLEGSVEVFLVCHTQTSIVSLNTRELMVNRSSVKVTSRYDNATIALTNITEDTQTEVFNVTLGRPLVVGEEIVVSMRFMGKIYGDPVGVYWSQYTATNGPRYLISTQMETTEARRAFPCVDDPDTKATFTLEVERQPQFFTLANTPLISTTPSDGNTGWLTDVFETTMPMSTYLIAFVVSDYTGINTTTDSPSHVKIGLWAQDSFKTAGFLDHAALVSAKSVPYFEEYFNYPYKWPKLDMVVMPKLTFGGMENWGLITFQRSKFLFDKDYCDSDDKQATTGIIAHEILHNWLGNTVTIRWWDDLWMTEGMARYFQYIAPQATYPSWDADQLFITKEFQAKALWIDDGGDSQPVYNPALYTNRDLDDIFSSITYSKGASVIRMMSKLIVGEDVFQNALKNYILDHQYANVDHDDLFDEMSRAYMASGKPMDFDLKKVMLTWIEQTGFPLVTVSRPSINDSSNQLVTVTQRIYLYDPNSTIDEYYPSPFGYLWEIPVSYITSFNSTPVRVWMHMVQNMTIQLTQPLTANDWILVNHNLYGYYRVNYDAVNWRLLADQLKSDRTRIPINNRAQLIDDSFTLSISGNVTQVVGLRLTEYLSSEVEYLPWQTFVDNLLPFLRLFQDNGMFLERLQNYVLSLLTNNYNSLGWDSKPEDSITTILLRYLIIETACMFDKDTCITEARNRFQQWRANGLNNSLITPDQRFAVYCTVAAQGSYDDWQVLVARYKATYSMANRESNKIAEALTCTRNMTTIQRLLDSVQMQNTSFVYSSDFYWVRTYIAKSRQGYMAAWEHLYKYGKATEGRMDILSAFSNVIATKGEADRFDLYISQYPAVNSYEASNIQSLRQTIQKNINWRQKNLQDTNDWLRGMNF